MSRSECEGISLAVEEFCTLAHRQVDEYTNSVTTLDKLKDAVEAKKRSLIVLKEMSWDGQEIQQHIETIDAAVRSENDKVITEIDGVTARRRDVDEIFSVVDSLACKLVDFQRELMLHKPRELSARKDDTPKPNNSLDSVFGAILSALQNTKGDISHSFEDAAKTATPANHTINEEELRRMRKLYMV